MSKPSDFLPQFPWEGPPVPRFLKGKEPEVQEESSNNEYDVRWSKLSNEQKEWVMNYLANWKQGIKKFYDIEEGELKPKFRLPE